jgi:hypothetical protein
MKGLVLISATPCLSTFTEYLLQKAASLTLTAFGMNEIAKLGLINRYFSSQTAEKKPELIEEYKRHLEKMNPHNLVQFVQCYINRNEDIVPKLSSAT